MAAMIGNKGRWALRLSLALVVALMAALSTARAEPKRLGSLMPSTCPTAENPVWLRPLAARGWVVGRNLIDDCVLGGDRLDRIPELAAELVGRKPDVLLSGSSPYIRALMLETTTIPIVMISAADPVRERLVSNLR